MRTVDIFADVPYGWAIGAGLWALLIVSLHIAQGGDSLGTMAIVAFTPLAIVVVGAVVPGSKVGGWLSRGWAALVRTAFLLTFALVLLAIVGFALSGLITDLPREAWIIVVVAFFAYELGRVSTRP